MTRMDFEKLFKISGAIYLGEEDLQDVHKKKMERLNPRLKQAESPITKKKKKKKKRKSFSFGLIEQYHLYKQVN